MKIQSVTLRRLLTPMREPFQTSFGTEEDKDVVIVELRTANGGVGFGECVASTAPLYSEETNDTAWHVMERFLIPKLFELDIQSAADLRSVSIAFAPIKRNNMAKAALEMAVWDAWANEQQTPLPELLGGERREIPVGISVGIQPTIPDLLRKIEGYLEQGFQRIKVKVKPGWDVDVLRAIRQAFGDIPLMADANSAYRLDDADHLRKFDEFGLMMVEQPLAHDDIIDHAALQRRLVTPICLDESIHSAADARKAMELGACKIINLKLGRVGGFAEALQIHELCRRQGIDLWCGGMLETGIGRLHNIAITSLPGFTLPGDTAPSARYFEQDIIHPPVTFSAPGTLAVEPLCGVADRVRRERLDAWTVKVQTYEASREGVGG
ncbi:o-succinylbenzoate synthase [Alicyclobacillus contaminans]|uniref:o-succinylbenzoate synthase n=1 Tax=Alicyclobacillus contaminans TaxID=392016 RepID=UPI00047E16F2|nr:o-succinylbenzoate synthase [Alicyclobacillus contaminans]GMA50290.1 o-succinylbenzoate synthase [Alicyclobacillus contaminans]